MEVGKFFLVILKGKKRYNIYKLIEDPIWSGVVAISKHKVSIDEKFNLKSYKNDGNVKQEKCVKFNEDVKVLRGKPMILKSCS